MLSHTPSTMIGDGSSLLLGGASFLVVLSCWLVLVIALACPQTNRTRSKSAWWWCSDCWRFSWRSLHPCCITSFFAGGGAGCRTALAPPAMRNGVATACFVLVAAILACPQNRRVSQYGRVARIVLPPHHMWWWWFAVVGC